MTSVDALVAVLAPIDDADLLDALKRTLDERPSVVQEIVDWAVPDKAYASSRLLLENRLNGTIKLFKAESGFGFIDCPEVKEAFGNDVFLHGSQMAGFGAGEAVSFALLLNKERKPQAFDVGPPAGGGKKGGKGGKGKDPWSKGGDDWGKGAEAWGKGADAWGKGMDPWAKGADPWGKGADLWGKGGWDVWGEPDWGAPAWKGGGAPKGKKGGKGGGKVGKDGKVSAPSTSMEMEGVTDRRFDGMVKAFNAERGFGFIACEEIMGMFGADVWLHHKQAEACEGFEVGAAITFAIFLNKDGKPQGKDVALAGMEESAAKRFKGN